MNRDGWVVDGLSLRCIGCGHRVAMPNKDNRLGIWRQANKGIIRHEAKCRDVTAKSRVFRFLQGGPATPRE